MGDSDTPDIADIIYGDLSSLAATTTSVVIVTNGSMIRNPSLVPNVGHASSGNATSGMFAPIVLGLLAWVMPPLSSSHPQR